ncbi:GNAT family N-acetyltransferase [Billgrantia saliphila]|uniref:GNAT family N-acetyltransferase n=1 Tax=Billgrantia saliphila TaxID=1848458 RepID=UPI000CE30741|nr:GNAT family N-acetyltransferase [Halomonas saliphila]
MVEAAIRRLGVADLSRLVALEHEQPHPWSIGQLEVALAAADCCVLGAEHEDALVGHAILMRLPFEAELQAVLVASAMRRHGLGVQLLEAVRVQARRWDSERLLLEVRAGNAAAIALYRRCGFDEDGRRRGYYPPLGPVSGGGDAGAKREDAILMSRRP